MDFGFLVMGPEFNKVITAGYNLEWLTFAHAFSLLMLAVFIHEVKAKHPTAAWMALGAFMMENGTGIHRSFWADAIEQAMAWEDYASFHLSIRWSLYFDVQWILLGMTLMARPLLLRVFPHSRLSWVVWPMIIGQVVFTYGVVHQINAMTAALPNF